ncbi:MAG: CdaR family transcriptional regulator [Faecousia sp.]
MILSKSSAQQIVEEIGKLVKQNINLMDETGHIIASNDPARIGTFHEGAYQIITRHLTELYITAELEKTMPLVRKGINLPIEAEGKVMGVIGITGDYDQVIKYGQIVKKMAEILIRERINLDAERLDLRVRSRFLEDWVLSDGLSNPQALSERGFAIGIDIHIPRRCVVVSVSHLEYYTNTLEGQQFIDRVESAVNGFMSQYRGSIILRNAARQILLIPKRSTTELTALCRKLSGMVEQRFGVRPAIGIDGAAGDIHTAYLQANRAWRVAPHSADNIVCYASLNAELILDDIPGKAKLEYLRKTFPDRTVPELRDDIALLEAYFAAEGSLTAAADAMFIHKNTLQYRLKRLAETTGLDVRKPSNAPALYLAVLFYRDMENEGYLAI